MREFMQFTLPNRKIAWQLALASLISVLVYLAVSALYQHVGFPLDDSWIHLTYARNLAVYGEWAFQPGKPSAGSTAPLWTALLSLGFFFKLAPYIWTYLLGTLLLWGIGIARRYDRSECQPSVPKPLSLGGTVPGHGMASRLVGGFRDGNPAARFAGHAGPWYADERIASIHDPGPASRTKRLGAA